MKKNILIASFDMEIGGVERSLISMLESFDYETYNVDLMLYRHQGEFMELIPEQVNLLAENPPYASFRKSIAELLAEGKVAIGLTRICAKLMAELKGKLQGAVEPGYMQLQYMWKYAMPFMPALEKEYDVAISYLWPHYFVSERVQAQQKLAWIHTDYATVQPQRALDLKMWRTFDHIIAVSEECRQAFLSKYGELAEKVVVMENISSPSFIRTMAKEQVEDQLERDKRFKLLTVARFSHAKGLDNAVKAFKLLQDKGFTDIVWYVVGYGGDEGLLRELIVGYGLQDSFILLGKKTNPYPYMQACDLYVQPSRYEGKAVTVTEAKILGKPVLITNYTTARSQVTDGIDGLITPLSIDGIAAGIERMYSDLALRERLARHCQETDYANRTELEKIYALAGVVS